MRSLFFIAVAAATLGGLFFLFKPAQIAVEPATPPPAAPVSPPAPEALRALSFELIVKDGRLVSGDAVIRVRQGDEVALTITSDKADELHLHGYDRHAHLAANTPSTLRLKAQRTGRFPFELHKSHLELGTLEVHPR